MTLVEWNDICLSLSSVFNTDNRNLILTLNTTPVSQFYYYSTFCEWKESLLPTCLTVLLLLYVLRVEGQLVTTQFYYYSTYCEWKESLLPQFYYYSTFCEWKESWLPTCLAVLLLLYILRVEGSWLPHSSTTTLRSSSGRTACYHTVLLLLYVLQVEGSWLPQFYYYSTFCEWKAAGYHTVLLLLYVLRVEGQLVTIQFYYYSTFCEWKASWLPQFYYHSTFCEWKAAGYHTVLLLLYVL